MREKTRAAGSGGGASSGRAQTRPRPARVAGLGELKGPLCSVPSCPRARSAFPQLRQTQEAPQPLWGQTQIVPGPAARPVTLGTKLNRLTSPGRCVATGTDSPFGSPRPRAEVAFHLETVGQGGGAPAPARGPRRPSPAGPRPCPALGLPPGSQRAPPRGRQGPAPAEETAPPGLGPPARARRGLSAARSQPGFLSQRGLCSLPPFGLPCFLTQSSFSPGPSLGSCSGGKEQGQYGAFSFSPSQSSRKYVEPAHLPWRWRRQALLMSNRFHPWSPSPLLCLPLASVL